MVKEVLSPSQLHQKSTEELKQELLMLAQDRDTEPFGKKVKFFKDELEPIFEELSLRNPVPDPEEQAALISGVWTPVWSTIPFQDAIPGRLREQSYQIFHDDGYYANIARYTPGSKLPFLQKLQSFLLAYDFMIVQKYGVSDDRWSIENIAIKQKFRFGGVPLSVEKAEEWFTQVVQSKLDAAADVEDFSEIPEFQNLDQNTAKRFKKTFRATPLFEHLYFDRDFRLVKSKREAKQRPSYTIAVRVAGDR
ncbi:hypothetical protein K9N68_19180 [Kovacikia minuta CCNUW1]|uniref:hypothetical protein n=1 Tax=Kovacikia minuta TaxID=2931930 RepID=UPI001CCF488A|nr:hypothetical protein [Kovacikia minuta]UBF23873.1 hypothetical protein K9N68_19180 [Kovacikia minuta CCNUW1]